ELLVREGATVTQGQVLIRLDDSQTAARVQQAKHAAEMFEAQVQAAHTTLAILNLDVPLAIERAEAQVGMMTLLVVAPMLLLSGIFTPLETMPVWVRYLMALSPLRYFIEIATGILLKGIGLEMLWSQALSMLALGVSLFGFGMWRFRRQFQ
ncbi:MAG: ABC transporter permease, partial [Nitrospira sp.]